MNALHLRERAVVPDVPVVGEAVAYKTELALLDILLDGVEELLLGDFHLGVGPAGNFDDHVHDTHILVSEQRDIMERRHWLAILLDEDAVL